MLLVTGAACAGPERTRAPLSEDVYVDVMARLSVLRIGTGATGDTVTLAAADSVREAVLRRYGVARSDLKDFARAVGDEPERMKRLWGRITAAAGSLRAAGWPAATDGSGGPPDETARPGGAAGDSANPAAGMQVPDSLLPEMP